MQLLQQRTLLGQIEGALDNVDLGAFLTRMGTVTTGDLKARVTAALNAYTASVLAFDHDSTLPDVSATGTNTATAQCTSKLSCVGHAACHIS
jgi:hypothetical protein